MTRQLVFTFVFMLILFFCDENLAQIAPAPQVKVDNITSILEKGGQFTTFMKLLKATQVDDQLNNELSTPNPNDGITIFAPSDNGFSGLKIGTLNSLSDQQKLHLVQFHILPTLMSTSQFQTASNPLRTQAGDVKSGNFPLNVTAVGNQVNLTTGVVNATVENTVYSDRRIAVYQVDQVLLPFQIFGKTPVPAPAPDVPDKYDSIPTPSPKASTGSDTDPSVAVILKFDSMIIFSVVFACFRTVFL